jgi:hypothetical protein
VVQFGLVVSTSGDSALQPSLFGKGDVSDKDLAEEPG